MLYTAGPRHWLVRLGSVRYDEVNDSQKKQGGVLYSRNASLRKNTADLVPRAFLLAMKLLM